MRRISVSRPERVTQWARMRNSGYLRVTRRRLSRFRSFRRRVLNENLLRTCDSSLKSATAGTRGWSCFCDAATRPHYPPTEGGVLARSSFFGAGKSFKIYVACLEKPCLLLGVDTSWRPKAVATAGYGLAEGGGSHFYSQVGDLEGPALRAGDVAFPSRRTRSDRVDRMVLLVTHFLRMLTPAPTTGGGRSRFGDSPSSSSYYRAFRRKIGLQT